MTDVSTSWNAHLPPDMAAALDDPARKDDFDAGMAFALADPDLGYTLKVRSRPFRIASFWELYRSLRDYRLDAETIGRITCPTAVTSPDHEQFWPDQAGELYEALTCDKVLLRFTEAEGASWHCEPVALALRNGRILDWLDEVVPA